MGNLCKMDTPRIFGTICHYDNITYCECPPGTYMEESQASACRECEQGKFGTTAGAVVNSTCADCAAGMYSSTASVSCLDCPAGKAQDAASVIRPLWACRAAIPAWRASALSRAQHGPGRQGAASSPRLEQY